MQPEDAIGYTSGEAWFYAACFIAAAVGGISRTLRDDSYQSAGTLFGLCVCSGILGSFVVAAWCGGNGGSSGFEFFYVLFSGVVGMAGKEADRYINKILHWAIVRACVGFGIEMKDDDGGGDE